MLDLADACRQWSSTTTVPWQYKSYSPTPPRGLAGCTGALTTMLAWPSNRMAMVCNGPQFTPNSDP